jgi:hypothetical protein
VASETVPATLGQIRATGWDWLADWTDEDILCAIRYRHFGWWEDTQEVCVMDVRNLRRYASE